MRGIKASLMGFEVEFFTINQKGQIVDAADDILKKAKGSRDLNLKKEISYGQIEIASYPSAKIRNTTSNLLEELEKLFQIAEKMDILLCPLGTYPGKFNPAMRNDLQYSIKKSIFGAERFKISGRCNGFHCHYTLPRGMFNIELRALKILVRSKIKDSLVNSYNLLIAADPALACFMQSSPYYQGRYIGKDSRVIMYRGGPSLNNPKGLYANFQEFGALPHYKLTTLDIIDIINSRFENWKSHIKKLGLNIKVLSLYGSVLYTNWSPIRISAHGTLEQRGMDMNHPMHVAGAGAMIKYLLRKLQTEYYAVVPSEIGIREPFKVEKDVIYIPPFPFVKNELQRLSAYRGLESPVVYNYCKRFLRLVESFMHKDRRKLIEPFKRMLDEKKTVSDEILAYARKKGFKRNEIISNKVAADIALQHSQRLLEETISAKRLLGRLS